MDFSFLFCEIFYALLVGSRDHCWSNPEAQSLLCPCSSISRYTVFGWISERLWTLLPTSIKFVLWERGKITKLLLTTHWEVGSCDQITGPVSHSGSYSKLMVSFKGLGVEQTISNLRLRKKWVRDKSKVTDNLSVKTFNIQVSNSYMAPSFHFCCSGVAPQKANSGSSGWFSMHLYKESDPLLQRAQQQSRETSLSHCITLLETQREQDVGPAYKPLYPAAVIVFFQKSSNS